jgi:hypothetical protein
MLKPCRGLMDSLIQVAKHVSTGAGAGPLDGTFIALFTSFTDNGPDSVLAGATEATYTGYARLAATPWSALYRDQQGRSCTDSAEAAFTPTDAVTPNTILAVGLVTALTAGTLLAYEVLAGGFSLPDGLHTLHYVATVCADPSNTIGQGENW